MADLLLAAGAALALAQAQASGKEVIPSRQAITLPAAVTTPVLFISPACVRG